VVFRRLPGVHFGRTLSQIGRWAGESAASEKQGAGWKPAVQKKAPLPLFFEKVLLRKELRKGSGKVLLRLGDEVPRKQEIRENSERRPGNGKQER